MSALRMMAKKSGGGSKRKKKKAAAAEVCTSKGVCLCVCTWYHAAVATAVDPWERTAAAYVYEYIYIGLVLPHDD